MGRGGGGGKREGGEDGDGYSETARGWEKIHLEQRERERERERDSEHLGIT